jgi:uncharacterized transporter YbjL
MRIRRINPKIPAIRTMTIPSTNTQEGGPMWPSEGTAASAYDWANIGLIAGLVVSIVSTILVIWMGNVKETYLRKQLANTNNRTAQLEKENSLLRLEILEIQRRMADRFITPSEHESLVADLSPYRGHHITVTRLKESEPRDYGGSIMSVLQEANWSVQADYILAYGVAATPRGVICRIGHHPDAAIQVLKAAFQKVGIKLRIEEIETREDFIELVVGLKNLD